MTDSEQIAYIAGFFDGEGHIGLNANGTWPALRIGANQVVKAPLALIHARYGGYLVHRDRVKYNPNAQPIWEWSIRAQRAQAVLRELIPYLIVKRERAEHALAYAENLSAGTGGRSLTETEARSRRELLDRLDRAR